MPTSSNAPLPALFATLTANSSPCTTQVRSRSWRSRRTSGTGLFIRVRGRGGLGSRGHAASSLLNTSGLLSGTKKVKITSITDPRNGSYQDGDAKAPLGGRVCGGRGRKTSKGPVYPPARFSSFLLSFFHSLPSFRLRRAFDPRKPARISAASRP